MNRRSVNRLWGFPGAVYVLKKRARRDQGKSRVKTSAASASHCRPQQNLLLFLIRNSFQQLHPRSHLLEVPPHLSAERSASAPHPHRLDRSFLKAMVQTALTDCSVHTLPTIRCDETLARARVGLKCSICTTGDWLFCNRGTFYT